MRLAPETGPPDGTARDVAGDRLIGIIVLLRQLTPQAGVPNPYSIKAEVGVVVAAKNVAIPHSSVQIHPERTSAKLVQFVDGKQAIKDASEVDALSAAQCGLTSTILQGSRKVSGARQRQS